MASFGGYLDILALLLDCGADINHQDNEGMDALHWAIRRHHPEAVKLLLEKGAYPNNIGFVQVRQIVPAFQRVPTPRDPRSLAYASFD